jgi:hypothetical protein
VATLLIVAAAFLTTGIVDTFVIQVMGRQEVDRSFRIAVAGLLAGLVVLSAVAAWSRPVPAWYAALPPMPWRRWLVAIVVLAPLWLIVGFVNQWPPTYLVGDLFLVTILPLTYLALTRAPLEEPWLVFRWLYGSIYALAIVSTLLVVYHNVWQGSRDKMSLDAVVLPIFYTVLRDAPGWLELAMLPVFVLSALLTTKRSTWAGIIIVTVLALLLRPGLRRPVRLAGVAAGAALLVWVAAVHQPELVEHSRTSIERRWAETLVDLSGTGDSDLSPEQGGRAGEVFGVYDTIVARNNPVDWAWGLGLGAIIQARGGRERHHVHSTPAAFLARTGVIGLGLWLAFSFAVLATLYRHFRRSTLPPWYRTQFAFWLGVWAMGLFFSLKSQAFWGSVAGGVQLAYIHHLVVGARRHESAEGAGDRCM